MEWNGGRYRIRTRGLRLRGLCSRGPWDRRETGTASRELSGASFSTAPGSLRTAEADDHLRAERACTALQEVQLRPGSRALEPRDARLFRLHALGELFLRGARLF